MGTASATFQKVLSDAIKDFEEYGYDDVYRLNEWLKRLEFAAMADLPTEETLRNRMQMAMDAAFKRSISPNAVLRSHPYVQRFTLERIKPQLRAELDRRILASADLIKINRKQTIEKTLQRFSGWATSIPAGGSRTVELREVKQHIAKPLRSFPFEERRVMIDQGHKLAASISKTLADQTGAIAMIWRSNWRAPGYDFRPDHKERDKKVYAIRGSWAMNQGLINKGDGYSDDMTQVAEEPFCRCFAVYLNSLRELPPEMLTVKGKKLLEETRIRK